MRQRHILWTVLLFLSQDVGTCQEPWAQPYRMRSFCSLSLAKSAWALAHLLFSEFWHCICGDRVSTLFQQMPSPFLSATTQALGKVPQMPTMPRQRCRQGPESVLSAIHYPTCDASLLVPQMIWPINTRPPPSTL